MFGQAGVLGGRLVRRVALLSLIAIIGLGVASGVGLWGTLQNTQRQLNDASESASDVFNSFLVRVESTLITAGTTLEDTRDPEETFRRLLGQEPALFEIVQLTPEGRVLASRRRVGTAVPPSFDMGVILEAIQGGEVYTSPVSSEEFGVPFVDIAVGIENDEGHLTSILVAKIDLTVLWNTVIGIQVGNSGYVYVTDEEGLVVAYRDLGLLAGTPYTRDLVGYTPQEIAQAGFMTYTGLGRSRVVARSVELDPIPWFVVAEQPMSETIVPFLELAGGVLLSLVFVLVLVTGIVRFARRDIVAPLLTLQDGVEAFRDGRLEERMEIVGHEGDEIGNLSETFNNMANQLESTIAALEKSVAEERRATAIAREASRLKDEFLATMSHELRTPLNGIMGFCSILQDGMGGEVDEDARHMIGRIMVNSDRLLSMINDVLDLAKIEAGRMELVVAPLSPRDMAQQWVAAISGAAEQKGLKIEVEVDQALPSVIYGDGDRLTQIADNLLGNAIKFTEAGWIKLELVRGDIETWLIRVSDTGIGIPPHALHYIFEKFRQVDGSSSRSYQGTGLGLSIVDELCRVMGGNVRVSSQLGKGSVFTVTLPLQTQPDAKVITERDGERRYVAG